VGGLRETSENLNPNSLRSGHFFFKEHLQKRSRIRYRFGQLARFLCALVSTGKHAAQFYTLYQLHIDWIGVMESVKWLALDWTVWVLVRTGTDILFLVFMCGRTPGPATFSSEVFHGYSNRKKKTIICLHERYLLYMQYYLSASDRLLSVCLSS
jgi:hypothetical protein